MSQPAHFIPSTALWNPDLAPTDAAHRTWKACHFVALWIGMVVGIPGCMLAGFIHVYRCAWSVSVLVSVLVYTPAPRVQQRAGHLRADQRLPPKRLEPGRDMGNHCQRRFNFAFGYRSI